MIFVLGFSQAFWQYFEYSYTLYENGLIASPLWSGLMGAPFIHHGYWGFIFAGIGFLLIEEGERRDRATRKAESN
jgi:hypothetical protein